MKHLRRTSCSMGFVAMLWFSATCLFGAEFTVDSLLDDGDADRGDGVRATLEGDCTLRAALDETNILPGRDVVHVPAGTF